MARRTVALTENGTLDAVGVFEAHLILGVERSRIARFLRDNEQGRRRIADPIAVLQCGPIWLREDVEETAKEMWRKANPGVPFDEWVSERAAKRASELTNPLSEQQLAAIIRRPLPVAA